MTKNRSERYFEKAQQRLVGGVNSPVRAFRRVGGTPIVVARGKGPYLWDLDETRYIDYVLSWGPLILGHAHPKVLSAIKTTAAKGTSFGACHPLELELAEMISKAIPSIQKIRFVSSGTEATLSALRLARGYTDRRYILKFEGCYHGHADGLLVKAGSGVATLGIPDSRGVTPAQAEETLTLPYNDIEGVKALFEAKGKELAAVIVEPIAGNMGMVLPLPGFLETLRDLCSANGSLLIFDEVMTGFRVAWGGAQSLYGIKPDLSCLGKVIGGGLPVGAFGGRADIMDLLAPLGPVYQAGTLSGNPIAMAAGLETLRACSKAGFYKALQGKLQTLTGAWKQLFESLEVPFQANVRGGMFGFFFSPYEIRNFEEAQASDQRHFLDFFHSMLRMGIYLAPSPFEAGFLSSAHTDRVIADTIRRSRKGIMSMKRL